MENPHKPNPQRATNRPRRPLQKKGGWERAKTKKTEGGRSGSEREERRHTRTSGK